MNRHSVTPRVTIGAAWVRLLAIAVLAGTWWPQLGSSAAPPPPPAARTGSLRLTFAERSPLSNFDSLTERGPFRQFRSRPAAAATQQAPPEVNQRRRDVEDQARAKANYDLAAESFEAWVPPAYRPGTPHGLFVFISAGDAKVPPEWTGVLARHKLIWVSANNTGNGREMLVRCALALDAAHNLAKLYDIDPDRVYIAGFSGGAEKASVLAQSFPDVFRGGYFMMGAAFYSGRKNAAGRLEPTVLGPTFAGCPVPLDQIKKELRLLIMDGQGDPQATPGAARCDADAFLLDGFERVSWIEVPRLGHRQPDAAWFAKGLVALESEPKHPPTTAPTTQPHPQPAQLAQARRLVATAENFLDGKFTNPTWARKYLRRAAEDYPTTPAGARARELLEAMDRGEQPATPKRP